MPQTCNMHVHMFGQPPCQIRPQEGHTLTFLQRMHEHDRTKLNTSEKADRRCFAEFCVWTTSDLASYR